MEEDNDRWIPKKGTWEAFRDSGMLWWVNRLLHTFGWAIVCIVEEEDNKVIDVYPARVKYRGFGEKAETEGFKKVSTFMKNNAEDIYKDAEYEEEK